MGLGIGNERDMGIQGLWQILEPVAEPVTLESLEGKHLAIDISIWLYQATYGYADHQLNAKCPHLSLVLRRLAKLLFYKIRPVFVFDGSNRDREVKRYVEELTMTKAQKHVLQQLASSQLYGREQRIDELSQAFVSQTKKRRDDDLFDVSMPSTSTENIVGKNMADEETAMIYSSFESSRSSEFDQNEFENLTTRDERVDYLLAIREKVRGLKMREVPDDSEAFSNLQIDRLRKRNQINGQLQMVRLKNEGLKLSVFPANEKQSCSNSKIKLATMEGLDRVHIITDDNEVQIVSLLKISQIDEEKEAKQKNLMDSLAWPAFLAKIEEEEGDRNVKRLIIPRVSRLKLSLIMTMTAMMLCKRSEKYFNGHTCFTSRRFSPKMRSDSNQQRSRIKGDMIERLRTAFTGRTKDLHHDSWSSSSGESSDEFVEVLPELAKNLEAVDVSSSVIKTTEVSTKSQSKECLINNKQHIDEKLSGSAMNYVRGSSFQFCMYIYTVLLLALWDEPNNKNIEKSYNESVVQSSSMCINPVGDIGIFTSTQEEGIYKDCQDLLRICGIPFIIAPAEAEAQCCELERLGLGIISDDSDVWLFGATVVYKNMFNQKRRLQMYSMETIHNQLGLSRWEAVQIALLSGGDYTSGIEGVGVVTALELISEFATASREVDVEPSQQAFENLCRISEWLNRRGAWNNLPTSSDCSSEQQNKEKRKFVENTRRLKLRRLIEKNNTAETLEAFPSPEIFNAYAKPLVDNSTEKPKWRKINMEELESFVWEKLGWDGKHLEQQTNHSLLKWNEYLNPTAGGSGQSYQMHITSFTHRLQKSEDDQRLFLTARVQAALQRLVTVKNSQNQSLLESVENNCVAESKKITTNDKLKRKRPSKCLVGKSTRNRKGLTNVLKNKRKKLTKAENATDNLVSKELQLSEDSSNSDTC
ncbi:DNA repair protein RAD2 [Dirofilaria immitis]|nr:DNA repair protein RAD2 [Dirofilaria immitis]